MARFVGWTAPIAMLALAACSAAPPAPPAQTFRRSGEVRQVAVGGPMLSNRSTTVVVAPLAKSPRVDGVRAELVYLGLLGTDPAGRNTARFRYEEHEIAGGVEEERAEFRATVTLDLARSRVLDFRGCRVDVLEATDSWIRYEILGNALP
jgi:hypothetical protein